MTVRTGAKQWRPMSDAGNHVKILRIDDATGQQVVLIRMEPGARYPVHVHPGGEDVFVLEGSVHLGAETLHAGDYLYTEPGGVHAAWTDEGCTMYVSVGKPIEPVR